MKSTSRAITLSMGVARERKYLTFLGARPIEASRRFLGRNIADGYPHFVALDGERVVRLLRCDAG